MPLPVCPSSHELVSQRRGAYLARHRAAISRACAQATGLRVDVASPSAGLLHKTGQEFAISGRELEEETVFGASSACHQIVKHVSSSARRELEEQTVLEA